MSNYWFTFDSYNISYRQVCMYVMCMMLMIMMNVALLILIWYSCVACCGSGGGNFYFERQWWSSSEEEEVTVLVSFFSTLTPDPLIPCIFCWYCCWKQKKSYLILLRTFAESKLDAVIVDDDNDDAAYDVGSLITTASGPAFHCIIFRQRRRFWTEREKKNLIRTSL